MIEIVIKIKKKKDVAGTNNIKINYILQYKFCAIYKIIKIKKPFLQMNCFSHFV